MSRREWNVARNGQFGRPAKSTGFRRNPQQHAGTGANRQEKAPTDNSWGFSIGGAPTLTLGHRTRVDGGDSVFAFVSYCGSYCSFGMLPPALGWVRTPARTGATARNSMRQVAVVYLVADHIADAVQVAAVPPSGTFRSPACLEGAVSGAVPSATSIVLPTGAGFS